MTGRTGTISRLGNDTNLTQKNRRPSSAHKLESLAGLFEPRGFISPHSDVVALMTLKHQATMTDLITRTGWEARVSAAPRAAVAPTTAAAARPAADRVRDAAIELVDYLLFVDETPLARADRRVVSIYAEVCRRRIARQARPIAAAVRSRTSTDALSM